MQVKTNGGVSFWYADIGGIPEYRRPLDGDTDADVCIVGGGYTGLWTSYYLKKVDPSLRIVVLEKEFAGFGASGRNGGWLSGGLSWPREKFLALGTRAGVIDMERAMIATVEEVIAVARAEGIDADIRRTDTLTVATTPAQMKRLSDDYDAALAWDVPKGRLSLIGREALFSRLRVDNGLGALVTHGGARIQPAKLVRGLAGAVERLDVRICEQTGVTRIDKGRATTDRGTVRAPIIVRATEGFTADIRGHERLWLPLNSAIMVTEPLTDELWARVGWEGHELLGDAAHGYSYAQRTREGRIAMGGRGVPYRFGSKTDNRGRTQPQTIRKLHDILVRVLPQTSGLRIDHAWCGVLGVPRDWRPSVGLDKKTGVAWAGGYVGNGVSTSNLSGQTLADLILGRDTHLTRLPWVNRPVREWEPEPLRWLGVQAMYQLYNWADRMESGTSERSSGLAALANRLTGR